MTPAEAAGDGARDAGPRRASDGSNAGGSNAGGSNAGGSDADGAGSCGTHAGVGVELRALALAALDRWEPALRRLRDEPTTASGPASCAGCPVCAVLALVRGERPELAVTLAEQLGGLLAVLRTALEEGDPAATGAAPEPPDTAAGPARRVQRIPVERVTR